MRMNARHIISSYRELLKQKKIFLKDGNLVPLLVSDVFVDGEDEHESKEEAGASQDVPDVVSGTRS